MPTRNPKAQTPIYLSGERPNHRPGFAPVLAWLWPAGLIAFGGLAGVVLDVKITHPFDKLAHIAFFWAMSAALFYVMPRRKTLIICFCVALAALSEFAQSLTTFHIASFADFTADLIGIGLFLTSAHLAERNRRVRPIY